jgi:hypothetical protein
MESGRVMKVLIGLCVCTVLAACNDSPTLAPSKLATSPPSRTFNPGSCGASFRMVTYEEDSLAAQYGMPATQDTVDICETWTGSDYIHSAVTVGSSDNLVSVPDTVQIVTYANGVQSGLDAAGNDVNASQAAGSTLFDYMNADQATIQASYDDPYYGVGSGSNTGPFCDDPTYCGGGTNAKSPSNAPSLSAVSSPQDSAKFSRHGLKRRGVRALVDDMEEIDPAPDGGRRFRKTRGTDEIILTVAPGTQLLVGEQARHENGTLTEARHTWRQSSTGWVKQRTDVYDDDIVHGHRVQNHAVIQFLNVQFNPGATLEANPSRTP